MTDNGCVTPYQYLERVRMSDREIAKWEIYKHSTVTVVEEDGNDVLLPRNLVGWIWIWILFYFIFSRNLCRHQVVAASGWEYL